MDVHCFCHLRFMHFGSAHGKDHGGDLQTVRFDSFGSYAYTLFWFNVLNVAILLIPNFYCVCRFLKGRRSNLASTVFNPIVFNHGHGNPMRKVVVATSRPSSEEWA